MISLLYIILFLQTCCPGGGSPEAEAETQQATSEPASQPREHHHRSGRHPGGRHQTSQYR